MKIHQALLLFTPAAAATDSPEWAAADPGRFLPAMLVLLAVLVLVFAGLVLLARVNALRTERSKTSRPAGPLRNRLQALEEGEIDALIRARKTHINLSTKKSSQAHGTSQPYACTYP